MSNIANNLSAVTAWVTEHNQKTGYEPELDKIKVLCLKSMQGYMCIHKERDQPYLQCVCVWWGGGGGCKLSQIYYSLQETKTGTLLMVSSRNESSVSQNSATICWGKVSPKYLA